MSKNTLPRAPRSKRAPFKTGEDWKERHERRRDTAQLDEDRLRRWAEARGGSVELKNGGAHWHIRVGGSLIQWWPESGRLVRDARWSSPAKAHDVDQVAAKITRWNRPKKRRRS